MSSDEHGEDEQDLWWSDGGVSDVQVSLLRGASEVEQERQCAESVSDESKEGTLAVRAIGITAIVSAICTVGGTVMSILGHSFALWSDTALGIVDLASYTLSWGAEYYQLKCGDRFTDRQRYMVEIISPACSAFSLLFCAIFLSVEAVIDLALHKKTTVQANETIVLLSSTVLLCFDIALLGYFAYTVPEDTLLYPLRTVTNLQCKAPSVMWVKRGTKGYFWNGRLWFEKLSKLHKHQPESRRIIVSETTPVPEERQRNLNLYCSFLHVVADFVRMTVIFISALLSRGMPSDIAEIDTIATLIVNGFVLYTAASMISEIRTASSLFERENAL